MSIELAKQSRQQALDSLQRYSKENLDEPLGNLAAGALLDFFLEEIGPLIYNRAVADVQERLQSRVSEIDLEVHEEEFMYWQKASRKKK